MSGGMAGQRGSMCAAQPSNSMGTKRCWGISNTCVEERELLVMAECETS